MLKTLLEKDMDTLEFYLKSYGSSLKDDPLTRINLNFQEWADNKKELFKLLDNQLIYKYPEYITIENDPVDLMSRALVHKSAMGILHESLKLRMPNEYEADLAHLFANPYTLGWNKTLKDVRLLLPGGKELTIPAGARPLRAIQKIAKAYDLDNQYTIFQKDHSLVLNQKHIEGYLRFSIHPMDFLTCSDNEYKWSSCMTVMKRGDYRAGTIEMMNSPFILEAYVNGDADDWWSKKWRCFFIVDQDFIISIRPYPYDNPTLIEICGRALKELAAKNWGIQFNWNEEYLWHEMRAPSIGDWTIAENRTIHVSFYQEYTLGYPDEFRINEKHFAIFPYDFYKDVLLEYHGLHKCLGCGEELEYSFQLFCEDCAPYPTCERCNRPIIDDQDACYVDGSDEILCRECYDNEIAVDEITGNITTDWVEVLLDRSNKYIVIDKKIFENKEYISKYFTATPHILDDEIAHPEYWIEPEYCTELGRKLYGYKTQEQWSEFLRGIARY